MTRDGPPSISSLTFDPEEGTYGAEFDNRSVPVDVTGISLVGNITGQSATDLPSR